MFPDLRLLIGALAASIAALCCGFGVFAAFRVNHEPLSRLPVATAPLQLVINEAATPRQTWGAPVGALVPLNVSDVPTTQPAFSSAHPAAIEAARVSTAAAKTTAVVAAPRQHASSPPTQTASANPANPAAPAIHSPPAEAKPAASTAPSPAASSGSVPPAETLPAKSQATPPAAAANESASAAIAAIAAIDSAPAQASSGAQPAEGSVSMPEARPAAISEATPSEKVRRAIAKAVERRRIAAKRRLVRKPPASIVAQFGGDTSTFQDPVFQSAPDAQSGPAARTRAAKRTANSGGTSNSFAWPNAQ